MKLWLILLQRGDAHGQLMALAGQGGTEVEHFVGIGALEKSSQLRKRLHPCLFTQMTLAVSRQLGESGNVIAAAHLVAAGVEILAPFPAGVQVPARVVR